MKASCFILSLLVSFTVLKAQNDSCVYAQPICTDTLSVTTNPGGFPAEAGPQYACLGSQTDPLWYYFEVQNSGSLVIDISFGFTDDFDFICWGPFKSAASACTALLDSSTVIDCSYNVSNPEVCTIPTAMSGEQYILMISNYNQTATNLTIEFNSSSSGSINQLLCSVSVSEANEADWITIYPNPVSDFLTLQRKGNEDLELKMVDLSGRIVLIKSLSGNEQVIDLRSLNPGFYFYSITVGEHVLKSGKLTKTD